MSTYSIYFSPTGGTKKVADLLLSDWDVDSNIDLSIPDANYGSYCFEKNDVCLIAVPSFSGRVPAIALERMREMKADETAVVLVVVYGNRAYDDTLLELMDEARACGFRCVAAVTAIAEHSIVREFGQNRPDALDEKELRDFSIQFKKKLHSGPALVEVTVHGNKPYKDANNIPLKPKASLICTRCGICQTLCPVGAIPKDKPFETDDRRCISCMRCVSVCPAKARTLNSDMLSVIAQKLKKVCENRKEIEFFIK